VERLQRAVGDQHAPGSTECRSASHSRSGP
jgi:hypothetical protein